MMRVAILHYHLRPGGVTRVIEMAVEALRGEGVEPLVISGEPVPEGCRLKQVEVVEELAYGSNNAEALKAGVEEACRRRWGAEADVLHTHNHALGKNLSLPMAVAAWAREGIALLLQIHDFAENRRPANYRLLREGLGAKLLLYPVGRRVATAVLNSGAKEFLALAGGASEVLPNPVSLPHDITPIGASELGAERVWVYPTRGIERKNLGEALLFAAMLGSDELMVITSSPTSGAERRSYQEWQRFAGSLGLRVLFDAAAAMGRSVYDFLAGSDLCLSTSMEEGFGMAFLEPWAAGKCLVGRDLPLVTQDFRREGLLLDHLYARIPIVLSKDAQKTYQDFALQQAVEAAASYNSSPVRRLVGTDVDFGLLPSAMQREVISDVRSGRLALPAPCVPGSETILKNQEIVKSCFRPGVYGQRLKTIYSRLCNAGCEPAAFLDAQKVLTCFLES